MLFTLLLHNYPTEKVYSQRVSPKNSKVTIQLRLLQNNLLERLKGIQKIHQRKGVEKLTGKILDTV